ncbi:benzoyl-CoA reductase/2-hydroxyglutaryl-CoA dehydratase subunit BcrC/BadD/HgdB [Desulfitispora alkaliphila]|uniref:2-hydroxyacyl-CoA dehydratase family protein n=1 Tax=Desulfitispora alkaliphila TaxID=622674 RepID=UPI003D253F82
MAGKIGITTTIPVEVIFAAKKIPVDLNNIFVTADDAQSMVEDAELAGYPRNLCGWIKGLYSVAKKVPDLEGVIAVTQGDCSNTHALMETLEVEGVKTIPFAFPYDADKDMLNLQIRKLMEAFQVSEVDVEIFREKLLQVRQSVWELDRLTWEENLISGFDNHLYQVSCSDFNGNPTAFKEEVDSFIEKSLKGKPFNEDIRLAYIGVPPIVTDLYSYLEEVGARVVFNEVQRQFTMPFEHVDLTEQYSKYTYPYNVFKRIKDIAEQVQKREIDGIIHYTQSFCFRQIEDLIFRQKLDLPILSLEGDKPGKLDARTKMRIESFVDMLR